MICAIYLFLIGITTSSLGFELNMDATLNIGEEVLDTISDYLGLAFRSSRRSLLPAEEDPITSIVRSSFAEIPQICDSESCKNLKKFIEEYTIILAKTIKNILEKAFGSNFKEVVYDKELTHYVGLIRGIIRENNVNTEIDDYFWLVILKKINSKFQELSSIYVTDRNPDLNQKMILATVIVETNYANTLCTEYNVCMKTYQVTDFLLAVLEALNNAPEDKSRKFVQAFYRALFDTPFYSQMNEETAHQLQVILYDISDSKETPTKKVLLGFQKIVEEHSRLTKFNKLVKMPDKTRLLHAILSDLDLIFVAQSPDIFTDFLKHFYDFLKSDAELHTSMQKILSDIQNVLSALSGDFFHKLINEVLVLLTMTIKL